MQLLAPVPNIRSSWCQDSPCPSNNIYSTAPLRLRRIDCLTAVSPWSESMNKNHFRWKIRFYEFLVFCQWPKLATVYSWVGTVNSHCSSWVLELVIGLCSTYIYVAHLVAVSPSLFFYGVLNIYWNFCKLISPVLPPDIWAMVCFVYGCNPRLQWLRYSLEIVIRCASGGNLRDLTLPAAFEFAPFASGCHSFINLKLNAMHIWYESLLQPKL
jgi:hypothetical protein